MRHTLTGQLPRHLYCWVNTEHTHKEPCGFAPAVWFGLMTAAPIKKPSRVRVECSALLDILLSFYKIIYIAKRITKNVPQGYCAILCLANCVIMSPLACAAHQPLEIFGPDKVSVGQLCFSHNIWSEGGVFVPNLIVVIVREPLKAISPVTMGAPTAQTSA